MVKHYRQHLIQFSYPENWELQAPDQEHLPQEISLESPDGCLWMVNVFAATRDPQSLLAEVLTSLKENYQDLEYDDIESNLEPPPALAVQADFFCLDFLITARIQVFVRPPFIYVVLHQAESRLFEKSALVFDAITTSLLAENTDPQSP